MMPKTNFYTLLFFMLICCFSVNNIYAQQCDTQFIDDGGIAGPYLAASDTTYTICPDVAGDVVTVTFTFVDIETNAFAVGTQAGCWDFLSIYSGIGTATPLQATACGELDGDGGTPSDPTSFLQAGDSFTSTSADGCLTITFSSDGSVQEQGWVADVTCAPPPACAAPTGLSSSNVTESAADLAWASLETSFDIEWGPTGFTPGTGTTVSGVGNPYTLSGLAPSTTYDYYVCAVCDDGAGGTITSDCTGPQTFTTTDAPPACDGLFLDSGGLGGIYDANAAETTTICPDVVGDVVTVTFTFVDIETSTGAGTQDGCFDFLSIYNGTGTTDTLQMTACGELDGDGGIPSDPASLLQAGDSFTSTAADGCLTFVFSSDGSVQQEGWSATITCAPPTGEVLGCTDPCAENFDPAATMDDGSCVLPEEPAIACYEMTTFNDSTCVWDVTGMQPEAPAIACYEMTTFNDSTCVWDVTGMQPEEPMVACFEMTTFNDSTCVWDVTGMQPEEPMVACFEMTTFNDSTCVWDVTGMQPPIDDGCEFTDDTFDDVNCVAVNTPNCPAGTMFDAVNCACITDVPPVDLSLADPCNCDEGIDLDGDGTNDLAQETITIVPGMSPFSTMSVSGLVDANGDPLDAAAIDALIAGTTIVAYVPADGVSVYALTIQDDNGTTASIAGGPCDPCSPSLSEGCTDPDACNYDDAADVDDGSCTVLGDTCDDGNPLTTDDIVQADCSCAGVSTNENVPTVGEWGLIIFGLLMSIVAIVGIRQRSTEEEYHTS